MSAPNFNFQRRCVYVPNDEIFLDLGEQINSSRSYPSWEIEDTKKYGTINIVYTAAYYEGGCIDIVDNEKGIDELVGYMSWYAERPKTDLIEDIAAIFCCPKYFVQSFLKGVDKQDEKEVELAIYRIFVAWQEKEVEKANKEVDKIKKMYGLAELACGGVFSNGEAIYHEI